MSDTPARPWKLWPLAVVAVAAAAGGLAYAVYLTSPVGTREPAEVALGPEPAEASEEEVRRVCAACHAYPPPDTFPRPAWRKEVKQGYDFFHADPSYRDPAPPLEAVVRYYEKRAPEALADPARPPASHPPAFRFAARAAPGPADGRSPGVTHVSVVRLTAKDRPELLVCDALANQIVLAPVDGSPGGERVIARGLCAGHAEVADLDGDGINDVIVACLGTFQATDDRVGSVVWLRGTAAGTLEPVTLLDGLGRVADVRAADFDGDGKLDLVVAEFGWHRTGGILLLENRTTDRAKPAFVPRVLDPRHGTTHVPVADLNGDGKPDFVAVISQEHETVVAFLNEGGGRFRTETIYAAPHPTYGCNGVQLVDLDADGKLDVVLTNGDSLDPPYLVRPDHGVTWLRNEGKYPFAVRRLADCPGAGSPAVADFNGNGLPDVAFATFLPGDAFPQRGRLRLESVLVLEQVSPGVFARHALEVGACDHLACAAADLDADGKPDLVVGNFVRGGRGNLLTVWRNVTGVK